MLATSCVKYEIKEDKLLPLVLEGDRYLYTQGKLIVTYGVGDTDEILKVYNVCVCGFSFVSLLFSQQQLKNLQAALGSRLEESLCIINEKVPFNDTSTYALLWVSCLIFLGVHLEGVLTMN